jgi:hypothetical protein
MLMLLYLITYIDKTNIGTAIRTGNCELPTNYSREC